MRGCQVGGLWNDYGACQLEYHDTRLLACQQHQIATYFKPKHHIQKVAPHILSIQISPCQTSCRPLPFGLKFLSNHHICSANHRFFFIDQSRSNTNLDDFSANRTLPKRPFAPRFLNVAPPVPQHEVA